MDPETPGQSSEERPEWLPANFETVEAFAESYKEAQRKITELSERAKQADTLEQNYNDLAAQVETLQAQSHQPDPSTQRAELEASYENDPLGTMAWLVQQSTQNAIQQYAATQQQQFAPQQQSQHEITARLAEQAVAGTYDDYAQYAEKVKSYLGENPYLVSEEATLSPSKFAKVIDTAYKVVKAEDLFTGKATPEQNAADLLARMKVQAQSATGGQGRPSPADEAQARWDEIQNAPTARYGDLFK